LAKLSEFEVARYQKIARVFLAIYEQSGEDEAGVYAAQELRIEELPIARQFVIDAFVAEGYEFENEEDFLSE